MKHSSIFGISAAGKKASPTAMARVLLVGLALLLLGSAALASNKPIPGIDIVVKKSPSGIAVSTPTGSDGTYKFTGLAAGKYDLSVGGQRVQTITVGANQGISGVLSREPDGKAAITFNGQVRVVPDLPGAPVNTSRSDKKAGIAKGEESPLPTTKVANEPLTDGLMILRKNSGGITISAPTGRSSIAADESSHAMADVSTTRGTAPGSGGGDVKPGISDQAAAGNLSTYSTAPPPKDGAPAGKTGHAPKPTSPGTGSNRSLNAGEPVPGVETTDVSRTRGTAPRPGGGDVKPGIAEANDALVGVSTTRGTAPRPDGVEGKLPGLAGEPIPGVDVKLGKNPGGIVASSKTDSQGNFHFDKLPAGNYVLTLAGLPSQSLTVGPDGIAGGTVMRGPDGSMRVFDRWGNRTAVSSKGGSSKTAEKPGGFGSGNTVGAGLGGMGPSPMNPATMSPGIMNPATMSPGAMGGAMAPGAGGAMGPGRAMGGAAMGRP